MKPCPFCDADSSRLHADATLRDGCADGEPDAWCASIRCRCCAAEGPWRKADTAEEANRRAWDSWDRRVRS